MAAGRLIRFRAVHILQLFGGFFRPLPAAKKQPDQRRKCDAVTGPDKAAISTHFEKTHHCARLPGVDAKRLVGAPPAMPASAE